MLMSEAGSKRIVAVHPGRKEWLSEKKVAPANPNPTGTRWAGLLSSIVVH